MFGEQIRAAKGTQAAGIVDAEWGRLQTFVLNYHADELYPHSQREPGRADLLSHIIWSGTTVMPANVDSPK